MRKLVVSSFVTLDGVMQAPGGPEEDGSGGFSHGGWSFAYFDEFLNDILLKQAEGAYDLLLGRKTYETFAKYFPLVEPPNPISAAFNHARKYVVSNGSRTLDWGPSTRISGDVAEEITKLKRQEGPDLLVSGSGRLVQTLLKQDLVDELRLMIFPLTLGSGTRLFAEGTLPLNLRLVASAASPSGVLVATYARAGAIKSSSIAAAPASDGPSRN